MGTAIEPPLRSRLHPGPSRLAAQLTRPLLPVEPSRRRCLVEVTLGPSHLSGARVTRHLEGIASPFAIRTVGPGTRQLTVFVAVFEFLRTQHRQVEPLYQLEKDGKLGQGDRPMTDEARAFVERQLLEGSQMLGALWLTAFRGAVPDTYLRSALIKRQTGGAATAPATKRARKSVP